MNHRTGGVGWILVLAAAHYSSCQAQIFKLERHPIPKVRSLHTLYAFYIYSHSDAPAGSGDPYIEFGEFVGHSSYRTDELVMNYKSVQLSAVLFDDFWRLVNQSKYCSTDIDIRQGRATHRNQLLTNGVPDVHLHTVHFGTAEPGMRIPIGKTGIYLLLLSNCGDLEEGTISGSVVARHAYGFLPGNEYHKMPFYAALACVYLFMAVVWTAWCLRWWSELFHIQFCILAVMVLSMFEAACWWAFFKHFNHNGILLKWLFVVAILFSVMKSVLSYMLVLVASLGWGVTRPHLATGTIRKIQVIALLYIILAFIRETVFAFRHSYSLSFAFVMLCLLPVAMLNGTIFYWVFAALGSLIEKLEAQKQFDKMKLFKRLWRVLITALALASFTVFFQMFDTSHNISRRWHHQWFLSDGASHIIFCLVLLAMMYLWAPHENSKRFAYSEQIGGDDLDAPGDVEGVRGQETCDSKPVATTLGVSNAVAASDDG